MRGLTLHRPWPKVLLDRAPGRTHGVKPVENRSWLPPREAIGTRIAIHAGKVFDPFADIWIAETLDGPLLGEDACPAMAVVGTVLLIGVAGSVAEVEERFPGEGRWFFTERDDHKKNYGWLLDEPRWLDRPIPCRGWQGLKPLPDEVLARMGELRAPAQRELIL